MEIEFVESEYEHYTSSSPKYSLSHWRLVSVSSAVRISVAQTLLPTPVLYVVCGEEKKDKQTSNKANDSFGLANGKINAVLKRTLIEHFIAS